MYANTVSQSERVRFSRRFQRIFVDRLSLSGFIRFDSWPRALSLGWHRRKVANRKSRIIFSVEISLPNNA